MTICARTLRVAARLTLAGAFVLGAVGAWADGGDRGGRGGWGGGFGSHPTLPVPGALVFGGVAIVAAATAALFPKERKGC